MHEESGTLIVVYVKLLSGSVLTLNQRLEGNVADLKKKIQAIKRISPDFRFLFLNGKQLEDEDATLLQDIDGLPNSTINLIQRQFILGIPKDVTVHLRQEKSAKNLSFTESA